MKCGVLIVDDQCLLRYGLRCIVERLPDFTVLGEAREGREAVRYAITLKPDLIVMDISMPCMNGIEATLQIKQRMEEARVLLLIENDNRQHVRETLKSGADGYLLKKASFEEFALAIQSVAHGGHYIAPDISMHLVDAYLGRSAVAAENKWDRLTSRERSILKLIAEGRTNRMVGEVLYISVKTVEKHRASLMHKLGLQNSAELVLLALEMGLIEEPRSRRLSVATPEFA